MLNIRPTKLLLLFVADMPLICGCSQNADERLAQLNKRQSVIDRRVAADEKRAAELRNEVVQLEDVLKMQRTCLDRQACWAQVARANAAIASQLAECNRKSANWYACEAERVSTKAGDTGLGCLLGWGFAAATGGSVAPAIAIGCGLGAKRSELRNHARCLNEGKPIACGEIPTLLTRLALSSAGFSKMPTCEPMPPECELLTSSSR